jgi:hypothetical protein
MNYVQILKVSKLTVSKISDSILNIEGDLRLIRTTKKVSPTKFLFVDRVNNIHCYVLREGKLALWQVLKPFVAGGGDAGNLVFLIF